MPERPFQSLLLWATLLFGVNATQAQAPYPDRPITMIVPFPPGGVADTVARPVAEALARELKQPVVVENKAGAGGALGIGQAARAAADGYTLLLSLSSISILPEADKLLDRKPAFLLSQFKPIARFTADPTVLVVRADAPWQTLAEFVADLRRQPGKYNYGSSGNYGTMHVPMEMLKASADFRMVHIPYTGAGPAVLALIGGQVDAVASGPSTVLQQIKAGKLRALRTGVTSPWPRCPNCPASSRPATRSSLPSGRHCLRPPARPTRCCSACAVPPAKWPPTRRWWPPSTAPAVRSSTWTHPSSRPTGMPMPAR